MVENFFEVVGTFNFFTQRPVHGCYDFRLKLLELLIENIVHFRFDIWACYANRLSTLWNIRLKILWIFGVEWWSGMCRHGRVV